ncbi:MAG: truA [Ilumatobacteraceae bacterium]|nr:truA [Ilumatobacteraceae bacterium]
MVAPDQENAANEPAALRRVRFVVAYDGSAYAGFAANRDVVTVAGRLTDAMSLVVGRPVHLVGAGRTDAGVHAWGQVISCELPTRTRLDDLIRRVNSMCGPSVVLRSGEWVDGDFSARFSATWRHYRYSVVNCPVANPFLVDTAWHVFRPLSLPAMQLACDPLIGEHDFTSFCRIPNRMPDRPEPSMKRRVMLARWTDVGTDEAPGLLRFEIRANAFCHQMVRSIVALMVDVGLGKRHAGEVRGLMLAKDRALMPSLAPAKGLTLWDVGYPSSDADTTGIAPLTTR